jgi:hypothetical protein
MTDHKITGPVLFNRLDFVIDDKAFRESAMKLHEAIQTDGFDRKDIGDYVIGEVYDFYSEERADELNAALLAALPGGVIRVGFVPIPMAVIKVGLAKVLDKVTPQVPLQLLLTVLRKIKLTSL